MAGGGQTKKLEVHAFTEIKLTSSCEGFSQPARDGKFVSEINRGKFLERESAKDSIRLLPVPDRAKEQATRSIHVAEFGKWECALKAYSTDKPLRRPAPRPRRKVERH